MKRNFTKVENWGFYFPFLKKPMLVDISTDKIPSKRLDGNLILLTTQELDRIRSDNNNNRKMQVNKTKYKNRSSLVSIKTISGFYYITKFRVDSAFGSRFVNFRKNYFTYLSPIAPKIVAAMYRIVSLMPSHSAP